VRPAQSGQADALEDDLQRLDVGRRRNCPCTTSSPSIRNSVWMQKTKSRSWPKLVYAVVSTAPHRSITSDGTEGRSISPMKSARAFMYAADRMLPASLMALCSSSPNTCDEPAGRCRRISASRIAALRGKMRRVRPVRSPSMCISTAATTRPRSP
jgi:hypothetical protein